MNEYMEFLRSLLSDLGLTIDNNDVIRFTDEVRTPVVIDGRKLVMPTERYKRSSSREYMMFHPLGENTLSDISPLLKEFTRIASIHLHYLFVSHADVLMTIATDPNPEKELTSDQLDFISKVKSLKSATEKDSTKILTNFLTNVVMEKMSSSLFTLRLIRGRNYRGAKRHRACVVEFPMYKTLVEELDKPKKSQTYDLTKDHRQALVEIFETFYPAISEEESYGYSEVTNRTVAPFFVTLMMTFAQLSAIFKESVNTFGGLFQTQELEGPELIWAEDILNNDTLQKWSVILPDNNSYTSPPKEVREEITKSSTGEEARQSFKEKKDEENRKSGSGLSPDEFLSKYCTNSTFAMQQNANTAIKKFKEGYEIWYKNYIITNGIAPQGYPHFSTIPFDRLPPAYPGSVELPMGFMPGGSMSGNMNGGFNNFNNGFNNNGFMMNGNNGMMGNNIQGQIVNVQTPNGYVQMLQLPNGQIVPLNQNNNGFNNNGFNNNGFNNGRQYDNNPNLGSVNTSGQVCPGTI